MKDAGLSESFIQTFLRLYYNLAEGKTGMIPEGEISNVRELPELEKLKVTPNSELLGKTVVLKLNGGLGTGMGLEKAKSLLEIKDGMTFLDIIAKQILHLRLKYNFPLDFMLMNSFSTSDDTKEFLSKYDEFSRTWDKIELLQNKAPKVNAETLEPIEWADNAELEWNPPGHGDLYAALKGSGKLDKLLASGIKYMFVSNSDNLGATLDLSLLTYFAEQEVPMLMEVCERTESDKKGGHLARNAKTGGLLLRESAQCPKEDEAQFQDITKHRFFNTNNLWIDLQKLDEVMTNNDNTLPLPLIRNAKTVDPRDPNSPKVFQLETAMGAAIASLRGAAAVVVPRTRFAPVKTCNDLFLLKSDCYRMTDDFRLVLADDVAQAPVIDLDPKYYKLVDGVVAATPNGVPSLKKCKRLKVTGPVSFAANIAIAGNASITNSSEDRKEVKEPVLDCVVSL
eukprot:TRINITY_DN67156_c8_g4_i1.p1 TRINITY_DN67156_c8_g4~~TRINITY_DN67156_c8_g4_i1.p1  ORF type:complete len:522 (-),score=96.45 TRINITY_DN67156_c8_g4_i1:1940-3298(-)